MNIIQRGAAFVQSLLELSNRTVWDRRRCPECGGTDTMRYGKYTRRPWFLLGRQAVAVQRHKCNECTARKGKVHTYSEQSALLIRRSWYAREIHRLGIDLWQHFGTSERRAAELIRSLIGHQERWFLWRPCDERSGSRRGCRLSASSILRWLDGAGKRAQEGVESQLAGVPTSGQMGTDGLWAVLRGGKKAVVLALVDCVSGVIWPPVVVAEEKYAAWKEMFKRGQLAGLDLEQLRGMSTDGANGIAGYLAKHLSWVNHQRCVFHIWRNLGGELKKRVESTVVGLAKEAARQVRKQTRQELVALVRGVLDARSEAEAEVALVKLQAHRLGQGLARRIKSEMDGLFVHLLAYNRGLSRVVPEWCWRDFRLRLSHGRNHGSEIRLERAALVWQIYHNFEPAQWRSERRRKYRRPGKSALHMAGVPPGNISYLDALGV